MEFFFPENLPTFIILSCKNSVDLKRCLMYPLILYLPLIFHCLNWHSMVLEFLTLKIFINLLIKLYIYIFYIYLYICIKTVKFFKNWWVFFVQFIDWLYLKKKQLLLLNETKLFILNHWTFYNARYFKSWHFKQKIISCITVVIFDFFRY